MNRKDQSVEVSEMLDESVESYGQEKKAQGYNSATLIELRNRIIQYMPELEKQVEDFNEKELQEILSQVQHPNSEIRRDHESENIQNKNREEIIQMFLREIPNYTYEGINKLYDQYGHDQIIQIYEGLKKDEQNQKPATQQIDLSNNTFPRQETDDNLNIYEIKKELEERMPKYRQEIKNLGQTQLRNYYRELKNQRKKQVRENMMCEEEDEDSLERPEEKGPRRRGRPKKIRSEEATLEQMKKELFQSSDYVEEYGLKSGYDAAVPNTQNQSNYESLFVSQPEGNENKKKQYSPYQINMNESSISKNENKPFCQIVLNLDKNNFKTESEFINIIKILKDIYKTMKKQ